jgi:hypothetical protein
MFAARFRGGRCLTRGMKLGLIEYNGGLKVHSALLSIVLHD